MARGIRGTTPSLSAWGFSSQKPELRHMKIWETTRAGQMSDPDKERGYGKAPGLERYFNESETEELLIHEDEREEFERESGIEITADVLADDTFGILRAWCRENNILAE
jgi:hypothetical protein